MGIALTARERAALKARAHALEPVVQIGQSGLTETVIGEAERALMAHELIKVKIGVADRTERARIAAALSAATGATHVQSVGTIAVLWRPRPDAED
ncbi:MAG: ribosome assembly RNA-binding protein YhbY [Vicinamibacterales bacterium]